MFLEFQLNTNSKLKGFQTVLDGVCVVLMNEYNSNNMLFNMWSHMKNGLHSYTVFTVSLGYARPQKCTVSVLGDSITLAMSIYTLVSK